MSAIVANCAINLRCELTKPVKVEYIDGNMFSMDNAGNTAHVYIYYNGQPQEVVGSVSAEVIRPDGGTVAVTGAMSGNRAYVIFPQAVYAIPGTISCVIKITEGTTTTTIAAFVANVYRSSTDQAIDPGQLIPSISSLISAIEAAVGSIPADYSSLLATIAGTYSSSKTYNVGDYAWESGVLKRCIVPITAGETFTAAHWTNAVVCDDLSALKSALCGLKEYPGIVWVIGRNISSGGAYQNNQYTALSRPIPVDPNDVIFRTAPAQDSGNHNLLMYVNAFKGGTWKSRTQVNAGDAYIVPSDTDNVQIGFGRASGSGIVMTQTDVDTYFSVDIYSHAIMLRQRFTISGTAFSANTGLGVCAIGSYSQTPYSSMLDAPAGVQFGGGFFANIPAGSNSYNRIQILYDTVNRKAYTRYLSYQSSDSTYSVGDWRSYDFIADYFEIKSVPSGVTKLSDITGVGYYRLGSYAQEPISTFITNNDFPFGRFGGGSLFVRPMGGSNGVEQIVYDVTTGDTATRYISGSTLTNVGEWNAGRGIKWAAIGDSITYGVYSTGSSTTAVNQDKCYIQRVANAIRPQKFSNLGVRGLGFVHAGNNSETLKTDVIDATMWTDYNLVTVALGVNDYYGVSNIGSESSAAWDGTVYGNIRGTIESIMTANPAIKIVFITPFNMSKYGSALTHWGKEYTRNNIGTLNNVKNAIKYWCEYYGIEYINETDFSVINDLNITSLLLDGLHPSWTAHELIAHELIKKIPFG